MTDSYAKWAAGLFEQAPAEWASTLFAIDHQQAPSQRQLAAALSHAPRAATSLKSATLKELLVQWEFNPPQVIVAAGPGPFMMALRARLDRTSWGGVIPLVGGSPGIAAHLSTSSLRFRVALDVLIVASTNERDVLSHKMQQQFEYSPRVALSTLPYISGLQARPITNYDIQECVFAAQPDIPQSRDDRRALLINLLQFRRTNKLEALTIKLRAIIGEAQTHTEVHSYQDIFSELVAKGDASRNEIRFVYGSMQDALENPSTILATVSSSAALEAIALGNPALIIADCGVDDEHANHVFEGSGLIHKLDEVKLPYQGLAAASWKLQNYFHPASENNWISTIESLGARTAPQLSEKFSRQEILKNAISEALRTDFPQRSASLFKLYRAVFKR